MKAARFALIVSVLIIGLWPHALKTFAQNPLTPDQPLTNTLGDSPQTYALALTPETPFVLEISGVDVYAYVTAQGRPLAPLNTETRSQDGMPLTRIAYASAPADTQVILEGQGAYTLTLKEGEVVGSTVAVLRAGDVVRDELLAGETQRYLLDANDGSLITLTVETKQRSFYARVLNGIGEEFIPLLSLPDADGFRQLMAVHGPAPYSLYLSGISGYQVSWAAGDTLTTSSGTLTENTAAEAAPGEGRYTLSTAAPLISIVLDEFEAQTALFDRTGVPLPYTNRFYDQAARQRRVVYRLNGQMPYTLLVESSNTYSVMFQRGDASQVDLGALAVNSTVSANVPTGRTPSYTLESPTDQALILTIFYDPSLLRAAPPFTVTSADEQVTQPTRIWGSTGQIQAFFTPQGQSPYHLTLALSGKFSLSLVARQTAGVPVTLTTVDTNLRSGPTINATVLRKGQTGETYTAIGRSADDAWVLLLTADDTALWVYRQLVESQPGATLATLPLVQAASVGADSPTVATQQNTASAAPAATTVPPPTYTPTAQAAPVITVTPVAAVCQVLSQGGVNVRQTPSMSGTMVGSLTDGQVAAVIGQVQDEAGRVWWQLADETWVRSDVVAERGDCTGAPVIVPR